MGSSDRKFKMLPNKSLATKDKYQAYQVKDMEALFGRLARICDAGGLERSV